ncbi:hypothetical protein J437_LFUL001888 [Ladona fulva]|uniref:DDE-1 domain-containing protein n=1 Tax=Ladona fulva TaxID=123851 RepID=A0A8K0JYP6_LADFU|nr:hypothetical protein J437_LFUL001888 [Ladona fulva]
MVKKINFKKKKENVQNKCKPLRFVSWKKESVNPLDGSNDSEGMENYHLIFRVKPSKEERIHLLLDNHGSHLSVEALNKVSKPGIVTVTFPPHTSHKLQPLDLAGHSFLSMKVVALPHVTQLYQSVSEPSSSKEVSDDITLGENGAQSSASTPYPTNSNLNKIATPE